MRWWSRLAVVAAGGLLLAKAHTTLPGLAPVALVPLLFALLAPVEDGSGGPPRRLRLGETALWSMFCYLFSGFQVWPAAQYGGLIFAAGLVYMALGGALFGALAWPMLRFEHRGWRAAGVVLAWVLADATRTMTPWSYPMVLGGNLAVAPVLAQLASVGGLWLLDAVVALTALALAEGLGAWTRGERGLGLRCFGAAAAVMAAVALFGAARMAWIAPGAVEWRGAAAESPLPEAPQTFALVQGGYPNWLFARATVLSRLNDAVRDGTLELLDDALQERPWGRPPDVAVTAENAFGQALRPGEAGLREVGLLARRLPPGTVLVSGATRDLDPAVALETGVLYENVAVALEDRGGDELAVTATAHKRQLVPFAESRYLRPDVGYHPLDVPSGKLGVLICYESIYPAVTSELGDAGAEVLLVVTNDAGLRQSYVADIHARLGLVRAIESGRSLVHAGQAGLTFFADAAGRRTPGLGLFERGVLTGAVTRRPVWTPYSALGGGWLALAAAGWLALLVKISWRMKAKSAA